MYSLCRYSHHGEQLLMPFINHCFLPKEAVLDSNNNDHFNTTAAETTASLTSLLLPLSSLLLLISQVLYLCYSCLDIYNHSYYYLCYSIFCCCYCNIYYILATYLHIVLREVVVFAMCSPVFRPAGGEWSREDLYFSHADWRHDHHLRRGFP